VKRIALAVVALFGAASVTIAPRAMAQGLREVPDRFRAVLGGGGTLLRPIGEFQNHVQWGGGLNLYAVLNPSRAVPVGLRLDAGGILYGHETFPVASSPTLPRVLLQGTTSNIIATVGVGPQVTLGHGWLMPYGYGTVGFAYFATTSELQGISGGPTFANTTNFDDWTGAIAWGGGVLLRMSSPRSRHPALLDLSVQTTYSGPTQYLRSGSITDLPDGTVAFMPIQSRTDMMQFRLGIAVGLR
jgi:hypothetical protein